jgi:transcriptional regulator with XRE-family HTH domain
MRTTTIPFPLREWRLRLNITQARAAELLGLSRAGYCQAEYRAEDRNECQKTLALLAQAIEKDLDHGIEIPIETA